MNRPPHILRVARLTLEARAPLAISSGAYHPEFDTLLARDANGVPMIPAPSLAGALRARFDDETARRIFGLQDGHDGRTSRLIVSDGLMHGADGQPVDGIDYDTASLASDPVLGLSLGEQPMSRDHVRINKRGVAKKRGKFTRTAVPAGSRFTAELSMWCDEGSYGDFDRVLQQALRPGLRLGGAGRSGYGAMALRAIWRDFDMTKGSDAEDYRNFAARTLRWKPEGWSRVEPDPVIAAKSDGTLIELPLVSEGFIRIGGNSPLIASEDQRPASSYRETVITWARDGKASGLSLQLVIPGSAVKGPLRHRMLFHLRRRRIANAKDVINDLFGEARNDAEGTGSAGRIIVEDLRPDSTFGVEENAVVLSHTSIDRFTGGVRKGVLFSEEAVYRLPVTLRLQITGDMTDDAKAAFHDALCDLKKGRLQIGAGGGDGLGVMLSAKDDHDQS